MTGLTGTGTLIRLIVRRDRIVLPVWIVVSALLPMGIAVSTADLYASDTALAAFAHQAMSSPAQLVTRGLIFAPTVGGLTAWTIGSSSVLLGGLVSLLLVIRHTRAEEEAGRRELVGAAAVGRHAPLASAMAVVLAANLALGVLAALGLIAVGLPVAGSFVLGLSMTGGGWMVAGIAAVCAQLTASTNPAGALAFGIMMAFFFLRGAGDISGDVSVMAWLSPFGWARLTRAYAGDNWWVFALMFAATVVLVVAAFALSVRRDVAGGMLPVRDGRGAASSVLRGPIALAWRLHRGQLIGWSTGFFAVGMLLGFAAGGLDTQLNTPEFRQLTETMGGPGARISDVFFALVIYIASQGVSGVAIIGVLRARAEEVSGRVEPLLSAPVARSRWLSGHLLVAAVSPGIVLTCLGMGAGLSSGLTNGTVVTQLPRVVLATVAYVPATWVLVGVGIALFGLLPRIAAAVTWTALGLFLFVDLLSEFRLISDATFLSPFVAVPDVLVAGGDSLAGIGWLTALAALLVGVGFLGWRRRDITS